MKDDFLDFIDGKQRLQAADILQRADGAEQAEQLGKLYESLLQDGARKAGGVYYTPRFVVDYIIDTTLSPMLDDIAREARFADFETRSRALRIVDPACGAGIFLARALARLVEHWQRKVVLTPMLKRRILRDNIFGVDKDAQAVELTRVVLCLQLLDGDERAGAKLAPQQLTNNIQCGDSLTEAIPILRAGRFDVVLGNPPWGSALDEEQLAYLRRKHRAIVVRMIDSFMYFVHDGLQLLRPGGALGMILPDVMLYQRDTEKLRRLLAEKTRITTVVKLGKVFPRVVRPACIVTCVNAPPAANDVEVLDLTAENESAAAHKLGQRASFIKVSQSRFLDAPACQFLTSELDGFALFHRLRGGDVLPLVQMVDEDGLQRGVSPDLKEAFIVDKPTAAAWKLERRHLRPTLTGGKQVKRYYLEPSDLQIIYTCRDDDFAKLPNICRYIEQFKPRITCKEFITKKHPMYALHRPRDEKIFKKPKKLVGVVTEDEIILALDDAQRCPTDGIYLFAPKVGVDIRYLLGILNSKLFVFIYRLLAMEKGRALAQVKPTLLGQLPIRRIDDTNDADRARHDALVALVDKMLISRKPSIDQQIDDLVYALYRLTAKERALVENATGSNAKLSMRKRS